MNIRALHQVEKAVSTASLFKTTEGNVISLQIKAGEQLKEHVTKVPALLICINGDATFENELGLKLKLSSGDYVNIEPEVKHWVNATVSSEFLLIK